MAEEEIVILEDEEKKEEEEKQAQEDEEKAEQKREEDKKSVDKKLLFIILALTFLITILIVTLLFLAYKKKQEKKNSPQNPVSQIVKKIENKEKTASISVSLLEEMIKKANYLYTHGDKKEALKIYENISLYNESISNYNIGVALMKEEKYKEAIKYFQKAIESKDNECASYINSAVCALKLKDYLFFKKYIKKAKEFLPKETHSPLYSHYMAMIHYYQDNYIESLIPLNHPSSPYYKERENYLSSKIETFIGNDLQAIDFLERIKKTDTRFPLALLYARIKEYDIATKKLQSLLEDREGDIKKIKMALSLIQNKKGNLKEASKLLKKLYDKYKTQIETIYPIEVFLKKSLFDIKKAQKEFKEKLFFKPMNVLNLLFYYTPYKVFNAKQTISYIKKGGISLFIDETKTALNYLKTSSTISKVNLAISKGIKEALNHNIYKANAIFKNLLNDYPKHSVLHFNLALTYAQIGDFINAHKHFLRSYHLNNKNYLAGVYAALLENLFHKENKILINILKEDMEEDESLKEKEKHFLFTLISLAANFSSSLFDWLEEEPKTPLQNALSIIVSHKLKKYDQYETFATKLYKTLPKDLIANILYIDSLNRDKEIEEYAKSIQDRFLKPDIDLSTFYNGYLISRIFFTKISQIAGLLNHTRMLLKEKIIQSDKDPTGILQSLAYVDIYTNDFEEAYVIYNELIDTHKQQDTNTLFFASVASIAANHHANAIALLELAKLTDPANLESRYALGILYQEAKNFEAASIQYSKIGDVGFQSDYFDFRIKE